MPPGCIADDLTGASDLSLMLSNEGLRTVQSTGVPTDVLDLSGVDALVIALKARSIAPGEVVALSLEAAHVLRAHGAQRLIFKYCSTFDSTDEGKLGPVIESLLGLVGGETIAYPAFPRMGQTIYAGHLFVNRVALSESPMKDNPLNPMRDSDLRRVLGRQTSLPVSLIAFEDVEGGAEGVRAGLAREIAVGRRIAVVDVLTDRHLRDICAATAHLPLITGGSGISMGLLTAYLAAGLIERLTPPQTGPEPILIYSSADPGVVHEIQVRLGHDTAGHMIEAVMAEAARELQHAASRAFWSRVARLPGPSCSRSAYKRFRSARKLTRVYLGPARSMGRTWR